MANTIELKQQIAQGEYDAAFTKLYGAAAVQEQRKRYTDLINEFEKAYGTERTVRLYSAPGRRASITERAALFEPPTPIKINKSASSRI